MNITNAFNSFYHGVVLKDMYEKAYSLKIKGVKDTRTNNTFILQKYDDYDSLDELKQLLKIFNFSYQNNEDEYIGKLSTKDIDNKELIKHIEWCIRLMGENGLELDFVTEEWDKLIQLYNR